MLPKYPSVPNYSLFHFFYFKLDQSHLIFRKGKLDIRFLNFTSGDEDIFLPYYLLAKTQQNGPSDPVVVGRWLCEPHNLTLLSLGGGSVLKRERHPSPIGLVFWGDWAFRWWGVRWIMRARVYVSVAGFAGVRSCVSIAGSVHRESTWVSWDLVENGRMMRTSSSTITCWQRPNKMGWVSQFGRRSCEPHNPTLISLRGGSHSSPLGLVFWGDWAFSLMRGGPDYGGQSVCACSWNRGG
jgi:hypothetical protein